MAPLVKLGASLISCTLIWWVSQTRGPSPPEVPSPLAGLPQPLSVTVVGDVGMVAEKPQMKSSPPSAACGLLWVSSLFSRICPVPGLRVTPAVWLDRLKPPTLALLPSMRKLNDGESPRSARVTPRICAL